MGGSLEGSILTPAGWHGGHIRHDERITAIDAVPLVTPEAPFILPGFVDLHVHGGGGGDVMAGAAAVRTMARTHAAHGTTAMVATTVTAPVEAIDDALDGIKQVHDGPGDDEALILGTHLEGPFLNPDKLGAQPPFARAPDAALLRRWAAYAPVRIVTFAPECDPDDTLVPTLDELSIAGQIGHTLATAAQAGRALSRGLGVTHLFNAMSGLDHRAPGAAGAALAHAAHAEIIADLVHVEATAILAAHRAIPDLYAVTDATAGAGMPDGDYPLGAFTATKQDGVMRLDDGRLAGSALTMDQALRNLVAIGLPLADAAEMVAARPARRLDLTDRGRLQPGARADVVVLDPDLEVDRVVIGGRTVHRGGRA